MTAVLGDERSNIPRRKDAWVWSSSPSKSELGGLREGAEGVCLNQPACHSLLFHYSTSFQLPVWTCKEAEALVATAQGIQFISPRNEMKGWSEP